MLPVTATTGCSGRLFLDRLETEYYVGPVRTIVRETSDTGLRVASNRARVHVKQVLCVSENKAYPHYLAARDITYALRNFDDGIRAEVAEYLAGRGGEATR